jgi:hypothetical protein
MNLDNIDLEEQIILNIESLSQKQLDKWIPFLKELEGNMVVYTIAEEKSIDNNVALGYYNLEIICYVATFLDNIEKLRELDESGMLSVRKTYIELEDLYYEEDEE